MKIQLIIIEFSNIKIKINEKVSSIKCGHQIFLQKYFFEIIKSNFKDAYNIAYERLYAILQKQIEKDYTLISSIFEEFSKHENEVEFTKFDVESIKEVKQMKEIEVNIDSGEDLDKLIPQDFLINTL